MGLLFQGAGESVYAVLDGASVPGLRPRLEAAREEWACLYRGELEPELARAAPYLVRLLPESPLTDWILEEGWGRHWGIFAVSAAGLEALRRHLRGFLRVRDHTGAVLYFRYYDPRVLAVYLPTCNRQEIAAVYGPISRFIAEDEHSGDALELRFDLNGVRPVVVPLPKPEPATPRGTP